MIQRLEVDRWHPVTILILLMTIITAIVLNGLLIILTQ